MKKKETDVSQSDIQTSNIHCTRNTYIHFRLEESPTLGGLAVTITLRRYLHCTLYNVQLIPCTAQGTMYNVHCTLYIVQYTKESRDRDKR